MENKIKIGISHGDINSISYEVIIKALMDPRMVELCTPIVYGSPKVAAYHRKAIDVENFNFNTIRHAGEAHDRKANIINCVDEEVRVELGKSTAEAGLSSFLALEAAVKDLNEGKIDAIVTGPINKKNIQSEQFGFSGHTEYLQSVFGSGDVLMLMVSNLLKVGVVSGHVPVSGIPDYITKDRVLSKLRVMNSSMIKDFGIRKPRLAVLGLNPHAGEEGLLGTEETEIIAPALEQAAKEGILAFGPYPADGFFGSGSFTKFDAVLAMYHDQGLIPFKTLVPDAGVNYTAGLPVVRTSPAHGTAYELAGKNEAEPGPFLHAIFLACDIVRNRKMYAQINKNPLKGGIPDEVRSSKDHPGE
jgi:4-hydroxythreonine-4-phosphate dehydrogenase